MNILLWQAAVLPGLAAELEAFSNTSLLQFFQQQPAPAPRRNGQTIRPSTKLIVRSQAADNLGSCVTSSTAQWYCAWI